MYLDDDGVMEECILMMEGQGYMRRSEDIWSNGFSGHYNSLVVATQLNSKNACNIYQYTQSLIKVDYSDYFDDFNLI